MIPVSQVIILYSAIVSIVSVKLEGKKKSLDILVSPWGQNHRF